MPKLFLPRFALIVPAFITIVVLLGPPPPGRPIEGKSQDTFFERNFHRQFILQEAAGPWANPAVNFRTIAKSINDSYGNADTIAKALRNNPREIARHFLYNIRVFFLQIMLVLESAYAYLRAPLYLFYMLVMCGSIFLWACLILAGKAYWGPVSNKRYFLTVFLLAPISSLIVSLIYFPTPRYMLSGLPFFFGILFYGLLWPLQTPLFRPYLRKINFYPFVAAILCLFTLFPPEFKKMESEYSQSLRETISKLKAVTCPEDNPHKRLNIFLDGKYSWWKYLAHAEGVNFTGMEGKYPDLFSSPPSDRPNLFVNLMKRLDINAIIISKDKIYDPDSKIGPIMEELTKRGDPLGFQIFSSDGDQLKLLVRKEMMKGCHPRAN